jgi:ankyrin repeat protein
MKHPSLWLYNVLLSYIEIVDSLLSSNANVNHEANPPLVYAWKSQKFEIVQKLISKGAILKTDKKEWNPWFNLMHGPMAPNTPIKDFVRIANLLLDNLDSVALEQEDPNGDTPLLRACKNKYFDVALVLASRNEASKIFEVKDKEFGWAPIHHLVHLCCQRGTKSEGYVFMFYFYLLCFMCGGCGRTKTEGQCSG